MLWNNGGQCRPAIEDEAASYIDSLAKPPGSLGLLEVWAARLAALQHADWPHGKDIGRARPRPSCSVRRPTLLIFAADHGSLKAHPALSAYPQGVTATIFRAIAAGVAASAVLARAHGVAIELVDVGVDDGGAVAVGGGAGAEEAAGSLSIGLAPAASHVRVRVRKIALGTADSSAGPAMTRAQCDAALAEGAAAVHRARAAPPANPNGRGGGGACNVLLVGELGLGNTTAAAALLAALAARPTSAEEATGSGTGVRAEALAAKARFVGAALRANAAALAAEGAAGALRSLGGFELAAMAGAMLEAARLGGVAVLVDGFIAGAAALAAVRLEPGCAAALFLAHTSAERGAALLCAELVAAGCAPPALELGMRLGEGTGALAALGVLRSAAAVLGMATLDEVARLGGPGAGAAAEDAAAVVG